MRKEHQYAQSSEEVTSIFGIFFCQRCHNMMTPLRSNGNFLEFNCQTCGTQDIDFTQRYNDDCLLYSKELQTFSRKHVNDESHIFDPTMPIVEVTCPECGYERAIYCVSPDENETKMIARMTCASVTGTVSKCGHTWELDEGEWLFEDCVNHPEQGQEGGRGKEDDQEEKKDDEEEEGKWLARSG